MRSLILLATMLASLILAPGSLAQVTNEGNKKWAVVCDPKLATDSHCIMTTGITLSGTKRQLLTVSLLYPEGRDRPILLFEMPQNVQVEKGVGMKIDQGKLQTFNQAKCEEAGCYIAIGIGADTISRLKRGLVLHFGYIDADGEGVLVPVSLIGFTSAFNALSQR